jgi:MFS family permease
MITTGNVTVETAFGTRQFWLLWIVLCMNVTAGIGVLGQASPMIQEVFPGRVTAIAAAGFVGLLSIFNMAGRFVWSSTSDRIGRRTTYMIFFLLGFVLYALVPTAGNIGSKGLFIAAFAVILSMYGGGFATIPAYLKDIFGTLHVGAIHGRLLTAWSAAGLLGPQIVTYIREYELGQGVAKAEVYNMTMYVMAGLLVIGFICNWLMTAVDRKHYVAIDSAAA